MITVISSHVKDKNRIFTGYKIFVTGKILVLYRCLYYKHFPLTVVIIYFKCDQNAILTSLSSFAVFPSSTSPVLSSLDLNVSSISASSGFSSKSDDELVPEEIHNVIRTRCFASSFLH